MNTLLSDVVESVAAICNQYSFSPSLFEQFFVVEISSWLADLTANIPAVFPVSIFYVHILMVIS